MEKVLILVGTMSGTAEMAAGEMTDQLEDMGVDVRMLRMEKASVATVTAADRVIICTSTYGIGEPPDNAKALFAALSTERPDLSGLSHGVFALGSSVYPQTHCFAGKDFDALFRALGSQRVGEVFLHDDRSGITADDAACEWVADWIEEVRTSGN